MKTIILTLAFLTLATCFKPVGAGEFSVSTGMRSMDAGEDLYNVEKWNYIKISYQPDDSEWYYFLSKEEAEVAPSYFTWTYSMTGFGVGTRAQISPNVRLFGQIGYYLIKNDKNQHMGYSEGFNYYFDSRFGFLDLGRSEFNYAEVTNDNSFGGTVGIELLQPISKNLTAGFSISRRMLKINEKVHVYNTETKRHWAVTPTRDYGSTNFAVNFNYVF